MVASVRGSLVAATLLLAALACTKGPAGTGAVPRASGNTGAADRQIVRQAEIEVEVKDVASALAAARGAASAVGGSVESEFSREDERATIVLRVPAKDLDSTLDRLAQLGSQRHRSVSQQDVTNEYTDLETRLRNAIALRDRLRTLAAQAKNVTETLAVETELSRVQSDVESMQARFDRLKREVALATVNVSFERARILGPLGYVFTGVAWVLTKLFVIR